MCWYYTAVLLLFLAHMCWYYTTSTTAVFGTHVLLVHSTTTVVFGTYVLVVLAIGILAKHDNTVKLCYSAHRDLG